MNNILDCVECHNFWNARCKQQITIGKDMTRCLHFALFGKYPYGRKL